MYLSPFKVEIQEMSYDNRDERIKLYKKIIRYKKDIKDIRKELSKEDSSYIAMIDVVKKYKDKLKEMDSVFYSISLTHKNSGITKKEDYINRQDIKDRITSIRHAINDEISKKRSELIKNTRIKKTGLIKLSNGTEVSYLYYLTSGVHHSNNVFISIKNKRYLDSFFKCKKPKTDDNYIGVEIECYIKGSHKDLAKQFLSYDMSLKDKITIKGDGSLRRQEGETSTELAILDTEEGINKTLKNIQAVLDNNNTRIDDSCGLHVHLDMRNKIAELCFHNLVKMQNIFYKMQPGKREENQYCRKTRSTNIFKIINERERYLGINPLSLENHQTLEIRLHEGTYKAKEINNWIVFLLKVCSIDKKITKSYRSIKSICKDFMFNNEVEKYVETRIKKYEVA